MRFVRDVGGDYVHFFSKENALSLGAGGLAALAVHAADDNLSQWAKDNNPSLPGGATYGSQLLHVPVAMGVWAIGAAAGSGPIADMGRDLLRAQISVVSWTYAIKFATDRTRPNGDPRSFPSGHASTSFATAMVLQEHFGWKFGVFGFRGGGLHRRVARGGQPALGERRGVRRRRGAGIRTDSDHPPARCARVVRAARRSWRRRRARHGAKVAMRRAVAFVLLIAVAGAGVASAQVPNAGAAATEQAGNPDSREAAIAQAESEKAARLSPAAPGKAEAYVTRLSDMFLTQQGHWHPFWQNAYSGGGFTLGAGYATYVSPYNVLDVRGSITFSGYKRIETEFDRAGIVRATRDPDVARRLARGDRRSASTDSACRRRRTTGRTTAFSSRMRLPISKCFRRGDSSSSAARSRCRSGSRPRDRATCRRLNRCTRRRRFRGSARSRSTGTRRSRSASTRGPRAATRGAADSTA